MKVYFSNTGCSLEEEDFLRFVRLIHANTTNDLLSADIIISHFCALSTESFNSIPSHMAVFQGIKKLLNPSVKIFVGGCAAELVDLQKRYPFIDGVFFRRHMVEDLAKYFGYDPESDKDIPISNHHVVVIQSGCARNCGFCKKAYLKMPLHSKPIEKVLLDVKDAISHGFYDIILQAENSTEYGFDLPGNVRLIDLLMEVTKLEGVKSLYLSALCIDELALNQELVDFIKNCDKIRKIQLEIQSLIPEVRRNMKLTSSVEDVLRILKEFSGKYIITNIMVGYPGETNENFKEELSLIEKYGLYYIQVNSYDNTPLVYGSTLVQIPRDLVRQRMMLLIKTLTDTRKKFVDKLKSDSVKKPAYCIFTSEKKYELLGNSAVVNLPNAKNCTCGQIVKVKIKDSKALFDLYSRDQTLVLEGVKV